MTIYEDAQEVASEVLAEFSQGVIKLVKLTPGSGAADEPGTPTETLYTLDAVAKGVSFKYVQRGQAVATDLMVTAAIIEDVTPHMRDFITIDGIRYKIVEILPAPAAGTFVVWKFIVRKGG